MSYLLSDMFDVQLESHTALLQQNVFIFKTKTTQYWITLHIWTKEDNLKSEVPIERDMLCYYMLCLKTTNFSLLWKYINLG